MNKLRRIINWLGSLLARPFTFDLPFLLLAWAAAACTGVVTELAAHHPMLALLSAAYFYVVNYIVVWVCTLWRPAGKVLNPVYYGVLVLYALVNVYCVATYHTRLTHNFLDIVANTNPGETAEYLRTYIGPLHIAAAVACVIVAIVLYRFACRLGRRRRPNAWKGGFAGLTVAVVLLAANPGFHPDEYAWDFKLEQVVDPSLYPTHPKVVVDTAGTYPQIVLILGESASPSHMQLYGYRLPTTPRLKQRADSGSLVVFEHATSPGTNTFEAFKYILNTHTPEADDSVKWYHSTNLLEVLKGAGYKIDWYSNQQPHGVYNNLSSAYSRVADNATFLRLNNTGNPFDGGLLELPVPQPGDTAAVIYHLMGQHVAFEQRYPAAYDRFTPELKVYKGYNAPQARNLARYDNATLYNDFVVDSIMGKFADRNAVVIYFSDHALDLYQTDPDYAGHATALPQSEAIGRHVPMMVYMTAQYRLLNPRGAAYIDSIAGTGFNTSDIIYLVARAAGISF